MPSPLLLFWQQNTKLLSKEVSERNEICVSEARYLGGEVKSWADLEPIQSSSNHGDGVN